MKKILCLAMAVLIALSITACGRASGDAGEGQLDEEEVIAYIGENNGIFSSVVLPFPPELHVRQVADSGDKLIVWARDEKVDRLFRYDPSEEMYYELKTGDSLEFNSMSSGASGDVCLLCTRENGSYALLLIGPDDTIETLELPYNEPMDKDSALSAHTLENGFLIKTYSSILLLDRQGNFVKELIQTKAQKDIVYTNEEEAIVIISDESGTNVKVYDENFREKEIYTLPYVYGKFYSGGENIYALDGNTIFILDYRTGERRAYVNVLTSAMWGDDFTALSDGHIYTSTKGKLTRWTPADGAGAGVLKMAVFEQSFLLPILVNSYNESTIGCKIEIVDYSVFNTVSSPDQGITRLHMDIVSGKGPDLIELSAFYPNFYASKGVLADLKPFLAKDPELKLEDLSPALVALSEYDGGLYELAPCFELYTLGGDRSVVGETDEWGLERFFELADQHGLSTLLGGSMTRERFMESYLMFEHSLVDYAQGRGDFEQEGFIKMLELSAELPSNEDVQMGGNVFGALYAGDQKLALASLGSDPVGTVTYLDTLFSDDVRFAGFPTEEGNGTLIIPSYRFGLCEESRNKEAAWDFFKFILSETAQSNQSLMPGIPAVRVYMEERLKTMAAHYLDDKMKLFTEYQGVEVVIPPRPADEKTLDKIKSLVENMDGFAQVDGNVAHAVEQETDKYYAGILSSQEVASNIQSRVSVYLSEQYG